MDLTSYAESLRAGKAANFPANATALAFAEALDGQDKLSHLRNEFVLPTKASLKKRALNGTVQCTCSDEALIKYDMRHLANASFSPL